MRLQFGILWVEDNYSPAEAKALERATDAAGFKLNIENSKDGEDIDRWADQQNKFHLFDLILLDLKLANEASGTELASRVRDLFRFTPILFYSGNKTTDELRALMAEQQIEGVFCVHRDHFIERARELISDFSMPLNRLSGMRGISMEVVAEADSLFQEVILHLEDHLSELNIINSLDTDVRKSAEDIASGYSNAPDLKSKLEQHRAVDSMKLFRLFRRVVKDKIGSMQDERIKDHLISLHERTKRYDTDVIKIRNVLGHAQEDKSQTGWQILKENGDVLMTVHDFPRHRENFLENLKAIKEIHNILVGENTE